MKQLIFFFSAFLYLTGSAQDTVEQLLDQGYNRYLEEDYHAAILDFDKAALLAPRDAEIYYLRGVCKSALKQKTEAMEDLNRAIDLRPSYAEAWYEKAFIFLSDQNAQKAIESLDKVIELSPDFAEAYVSRGTAKCMLNDKEGAEKDWATAKKLGVTYTELMICE